MKYELYVNEKGDNRVRFPEYDEDYVVNIDSEGRKYFSTLNPRSTEGGLVDRFSFYGKIWDAVEEIRAGNGDVIDTSSIFGGSSQSIEVRIYEDREYGEQLRQKSIEGWKDSKFGYGAVLTTLNSFSGPRLIVMRDGVAMTALDSTDKEILFFDTKEQAQEWVDSVKSKVEKDASDFVKLGVNNEDIVEQREFLLMFDETYGPTSVTKTYFMSKVGELVEGVKTYDIDVVQVVRN